MVLLTLPESAYVYFRKCSSLNLYSDNINDSVFIINNKLNYVTDYACINLTEISHIANYYKRHKTITVGELINVLMKIIDRGKYRISGSYKHTDEYDNTKHHMIRVNVFGYDEENKTLTLMDDGIGNLSIL